MNLELSPLELEELKELVESSINRITLEIRQAPGPQKKIQLKEQRDELNKFLSKIKSKSEKNAA